MENFTKLIEQCVYSNNIQALENNLKFIQTILDFIFDQIKKTDTEKDAEIAFALLENIQFVLAKAAFKNKITLTPTLNRFVSDFDRIDDQEVKAFLYKKIKSNRYVL